MPLHVFLQNEDRIEEKNLNLVRLTRAFRKNDSQELTEVQRHKTQTEENPPLEMQPGELKYQKENGGFGFVHPRVHVTQGGRMHAFLGQHIQKEKEAFGYFQQKYADASQQTGETMLRTFLNRKTPIKKRRRLQKRTDSRMTLSSSHHSLSLIPSSQEIVDEESKQFETRLLMDLGIDPHGKNDDIQRELKKMIQINKEILNDIQDHEQRQRNSELDGIRVQQNQEMFEMICKKWDRDHRHDKRPLSHGAKPTMASDMSSSLISGFGILSPASNHETFHTAVQMQPTKMRPLTSAVYALKPRTASMKGKTSEGFFRVTDKSRHPQSAIAVSNEQIASNIAKSVQKTYHITSAHTNERTALLSANTSTEHLEKRGLRPRQRVPLIDRIGYLRVRDAWDH